jgi:hypothetical protein
LLGQNGEGKYAKMAIQRRWGGIHSICYETQRLERIGIIMALSFAICVLFAYMIYNAVFLPRKSLFGVKMPWNALPVEED